MKRYIRLDRRKIASAIKSDICPNIIVKRRTDSTNSFGKRMFDSGRIKENTIILAEHQTRGRGRSGRSFYSPSHGGLYMSLCIECESLRSAVSLSSICAVATAQAIASMTELSPRIKWVNDIYIDEKKACGILCESTPYKKGYGIIMGIGVNTAACDFPIFENNTPTSIGNIDRNILCAKIYDGIIRYMSDPSYTERYKELSYLDNKHVTVFEGNDTYTARVIGIDDACGLVIIKDGEENTRTLTSGEVSLRVK